MELIDTHSHLNFRAYDKDRKEAISRSLANGVWMINVGIDLASSKKAVRIAENYEQGVYAAVGLHPLDAGKEEFAYGEYKRLAQSSDKVVAIGEIGLDWLNKPDGKAVAERFTASQEQLLEKQVRLAAELGLPVIFHCRKAHSSLISFLQQSKPANSACRGVIHCFTGRWREAEKYLQMGFYLGFNGIIFKLNLREVIAKTPLERILAETDCPFLLPPSATPPVEGRNEPLFLKHIIQRIAEIKGVSFAEVARATFANARNLFGI